VKDEAKANLRVALRAHSSAVKRLQAAHEAEWLAIYNEERALLGLDSVEAVKAREKAKGKVGVTVNRVLAMSPDERAAFWKALTEAGQKS
jgi:hypothetical protein